MPERLLVLCLVVLVAGCNPGPPSSASAPAAPSADVTPSGSPPPASPSPSMPSSPPAAASPSASQAPSRGADGLEVLELDVTGCPGGVALDWSPTSHPEFHHYTALRSLEPDVAPSYPPIAPAVDWGDSYGTDRFVTSAVDATLIPSEAVFYYRVMAYDQTNRPLAASPVRRSRPAEPVDLGALVVEAGADGHTSLDWSLFGGLGRCFSAYRVLIGPGGGTPSTTLTVIASQSLTELDTPALRSGETYALRVDAVRTTTLGSFVVGSTETATYTVP